MNYVKSSQLPHVASANVLANGDRLLVLTNPTATNAALQTVDIATAVNSLSVSFANATAPFFIFSAAVNNSFVANSTGVYSTNLVTNNASVNTNIFVGNTTVNTNIGWNVTDSSLAEFAGNVNNFVEIAVYNSNSGINASGDVIINDNLGIASNNYIDIGINSNTWSNSSWTINGPSDGYIYTGNTNLSIGTVTSKFINFFTSGGLASNERMRITPTGNVGIGNTAPIHLLSVNGNTYISNNLFVIGSTTVNNNLTVNGNLTVTGNVTFAGSTTYVNSTVITTNDLNIVLASNASINALANNAGIIIGTAANLIYNASVSSWQSNISFVPATNNLNLGSATQLWNLYANNGFFNGSVNSTSHIVGTSFIANSTGAFIGNTTVNNQITWNATTLSNFSSYTNVNNYSIIYNQNINGGVSSSADIYAFNNDITQFTYIDMGINSSNWSNTLWTINGPSDGYLYTSNSNLSVGSNALNGYVNFFVGGTFANNEVMRLGNTGLNIGNANNTVARLWVGNSIVNTTINSSSMAIGTAFTANTTLVNALAINVTNQTNTATLFVTTSANVGTAVTANSTGVFTTGSVNAASHTVGAATIANSTGVFTTGSVNASVVSVGTTFIANSTVLTFTPNTFNLGSVSKTANGYVWLPNGVLYQWGTVAANTTVGNATFPIAFPTACQSVALSLIGSANVAYQVAAPNTTIAQVRSSSATTALNVEYVAIGY